MAAAAYAKKVLVRTSPTNTKRQVEGEKQLWKKQIHHDLIHFVAKRFSSVETKRSCQRRIFPNMHTRLDNSMIPRREMILRTV